MTFSKENLRILARTIKETADNSANIFEEGKVIDISRKSKMVQVELYPNKQKVWCRILFPYVAKDVWSGGMPIKGARCLLAKVTKINDIYEDCVIIGFLHDENVNSENENNKADNNDPNYYCIEPINGGKIELYKDSNNKQRLKITGLQDLDIICEDGYINIISDDISIGEANLGDDKKIVLSPHLDKYDDFIDAVSNWINLATPTLTATGAFVGAIFPPNATIDYTIASNQAKENGGNKTSKTKAS